jgi:Flp pilus assembly pilin Flp
MLADRRGADLVEWIVGVIVVVAVIGGSAYALFQTLADRFWELNGAISP